MSICQSTNCQVGLDQCSLLRKEKQGNSRGRGHHDDLMSQRALGFQDITANYNEIIKKRM